MDFWLFILRDVLPYYYIIMNVLGFVFMGLDKFYAVKKRRRIPEATLLLISGLGGCVGGFLGMHLFRHKTRKPKFAYGIPAMIAAHILLILILF